MRVTTCKFRRPTSRAKVTCGMSSSVTQALSRDWPSLTCGRLKRGCHLVLVWYRLVWEKNDIASITTTQSGIVRRPVARDRASRRQEFGRNYYGLVKNYEKEWQVKIKLHSIICLKTGDLSRTRAGARFLRRWAGPILRRGHNFDDNPLGGIAGRVGPA